MSKRAGKSESLSRRVYTDEFKQEAVQMLLDGHSAGSVCERLGLSGTNLLYRWKKKILGREGGLASNLEGRVRELARPNAPPPTDIGVQTPLEIPTSRRAHTARSRTAPPSPATPDVGSSEDPSRRPRRRVVRGG